MEVYFLLKDAIYDVNVLFILHSSSGNLSYLWNFEVCSIVCLVIQILTGVFLAMHYTPEINLAIENNVKQGSVGTQTTRSGVSAGDDDDDEEKLKRRKLVKRVLIGVSLVVACAGAYFAYVHAEQIAHWWFILRTLDIEPLIRDYINTHGGLYSLAAQQPRQNSPLLQRALEEYAHMIIRHREIGESRHADVLRIVWSIYEEIWDEVNGTVD